MKMKIKRTKDGEDFIPLENRRENKKTKGNPFQNNLKEQKEKRRQKRARIIVRNISYKATDESFREYFEKYGKITDFQLLKRGDGKLVGCGFVQFETVTQAAKAILKANSSAFLERPIIVDWALGKNEYEKKKASTNSDTMPKYDGKGIKIEDVNLEKIKVEKENNDVQEETFNTSDDEEMSQASDKISEEECSEKSSNDSMEEDEDEDEYDDDFMKNDDEDDEDDDEEDKKIIIKKEPVESKPKFKSNDIKEECTVFIKNVPFDATSNDLNKLCRKFGPIYYALINKDPLSGHSRGTAFVKFKTKESAELCMKAGEEFVLMDQILEALPALSKEDVVNKSNKNGDRKDARNLYLIKEGLIMTGSTAAEGVSSSDMAKRHKIEQVKAQVLKNLNRFVSRNRLSIHNLPLNYDDEKLKNMIIKHTQFKPHECRIIRENKPSVGFPKGKSKGFGFMSFKSHKEALMALRNLNNNPAVFGNQNRPIVGFSIEDRSVHNIKQKRLQKSRQNNPTYKEKLEKKKFKKLQKDDKTAVQTNSKVNKTKIQKDNMNNSTNEEDFMGVSAKPGSFVRMRSVKKIREQSLEHKKKVGELKRKIKKGKERKQLRMEKKSIDRPKQGKRKSEPDNFSILVNKYKNIIDSKTDKIKKTKRTKWYTD